MQRILLIILVLGALVSCKDESKSFFILREKSETGLDFENRLTSTRDFNMFKYMYFYNGAGCGAADFNNDGLTDLFFASNQGQNKIYLNEGKLHFKDITQQAGIPEDHGWSTGVSIADVNADGLNDIYVCRVGQFETLKGKNQLLICTGIDTKGIPHYTEKAAAYGLDFSGFSTQAAFFDYDLDGDLDMFLLNHSVHQNGTFAERKNFIGTYHPLSGDQLYRNDGSRFTNVTVASQINSSAIGYGLGICVADINLDGYPDIYIGNDFHENDYLYLNQKNGTFKETLNEHIMHTSQFSMGVDVADINNDAFPDIISMDMLPADPYILKRSLGEDEYNTFQMKIGYGYNHQYTRNNLQINRRNGLFSETGLYSGVAATDWSWSALFMDFDNDGLKDLFISNGIPKRLNDIDYVNYISNEALQQKIDNNQLDDKEMAVIDKFPQIKLANKFYHNQGAAKFEDWEKNIGNDLPTFSNGSVYADFDNDGDLDLVVNNIDDPVMLYENRSEKQHPANQWTQIKLKGPVQNSNAVGAKILLYKKDALTTYEKFPVRGFLSSMEIPLTIGLGHTNADSAFLIWPDQTYQKITLDTNKLQTFTYERGLPIFDYGRLQNHSLNPLPFVKDITQESGLNYLHTENRFNEFDRELLIPHMTSREGPALAVGDCNGDGLEDIFVGSSKGYKPGLYLQNKNGKFVASIQSELMMDSVYEETAAVWVDVNKDGYKDLVIADGGNEYYGKSEYLQPRLFLNDGKGRLHKNNGAFAGVYINASCISVQDINNDGYPDLFIGGRTVPFEYGSMPESYLLINDRRGGFSNMTGQLAPELMKAGMVTGAEWADLDGDQDADLVISAEWGPVSCWLNDHGHFRKQDISSRTGWWNFVKLADLDNDGDLDIIAGNLGLNSRLKASKDQPVRLYYNDFDDNGTKEQLLSYFVQGKEIPFANKDELQKQLPFLKKKYLYAEHLAKADFKDIVGSKKLKTSTLLTSEDFTSRIWINQGNMKFTELEMPEAAQWSPLRDALIFDFNHDQLPDILLVGNYYENNIEMGRYDADYGTILINKGKGVFHASLLNGFSIRSEARQVKPISLNHQKAFVIASSNDSLRVIQP